MATTYKYVVDKDWDSQQITDIVTYDGAGKYFTYGTDGFASIYKTIFDANGIKVPGAVGIANYPAESGNLATPIDITTERQTINIVNGHFAEDVYALADQKYTLDFSSIYTDLEHLTSFVGNITSSEGNDVGIRVSSGTVLFGEEADIVDDEITNRTTINLNRKQTGSVGQWADSEFVVGGALAGQDAVAATAIVNNTDLTVAHWIWVGSQNDVHQSADDAVVNYLFINNSAVKSTTLQVRNTGSLVVVDSTVDTTAMVLRHNASFLDSAITVGATGNFNVYGENGVTATLTLAGTENGGSVLTAEQALLIGKPDSGTTDVERAGVVKLIKSSIGYVIPDDLETPNVDEYQIVRSGDITVNQNGTLTMDAASKIYAGTITNGGTINITIDAAGEDWIDATAFNNTVIPGETEGAVIKNLNIAGSFDGGVKRVINAGSGSVDVNSINVTATSTDGKEVTAATRGGKVAIAAGVDYTTLYLSNKINEEADFAKEVKDTTTKSYYVDFNAFQLPKSALEEGVKENTTTILIDGTTAAALTYTGVTTASIDGLTFAKDGTNAVDPTAEEKNVVFTLTGMDPTNPASYRELTKGITVGEGVTFTADKLYQTGKEAVTTINGELAMLENDTFQIAGGTVYVNETGSLTGDGIISVIATLRDAEAKPIKAELNVTEAPISLNKLEIGANSTVTLRDIAPTTTGASQAVFNNIVMRKTNVQDFDAPVLSIINSQVTVDGTFDLGAKLPTDPDTIKLGRVDINFQSQLFVETATGTIEGGNLNLTVSDTDIALLNSGSAELFYTIVHAAISDDVNLTCDHDVDGDTYIDGTKYVYTSLGGQGLYVMHEDVAKNIYVNAAWTNKKTGDVVGDGMFYGINAFETFTGALSAASELENACSITLLSDVTENNLETMSYKLQNAVTVKGNFTVVWNVTTQTQDDGSVYFFGGKDKTSEKLTFEAGTTYEAHGMGPIYIGYDPTNDKGPEDRMDAEFAGTIQNSSVYVARWSSLTVTGTITGGAQIYNRKHGKILIDGTGKTFETPQVSTTDAALIYGGTTSVLNSVVSIGGQLKVSNRNVTGEADYNMPAETTVFGATNSTISAKSFDSNKVGTETKGDVKDSVTSLVKSTMTITNGVDNYGTFYVGVAVKAKDITEGETIVKNTVEVDESITGEAAASTLIVGSTVANNGVIELKYSTATITGELKNNAGGVITITDSTVSASKVTNGPSTDYATININKNGVLNVTTSGSHNNGGYGIFNVTGGTVTATSNGCTFWNNGIMNLDDAEFAFHDKTIRNQNSAVININGDVDVHDENDEMGLIYNAAKGKVVFGVSNAGTGAANVDVNIVGGTVAFSAANLTFDMAVTGVNNAGTADEAIASAKLSGGTIFVDKAGITLTDSGFEVPATTEEPIVPAHTVWNNTNFIKIGASGSLTLDKTVAGWNNVSSAAAANNSLVVTGLDIAAGGNLKMDWSQCLTVNGTLSAAAGATVTVTLNPLEVYTSLDTDKLVIANEYITTLDGYSFVENCEKFFTIHVNGVEEWTGVTGLYLDASKFVKVSQAHVFAPEDGWYKQFNTVPGSQLPADQGAVDSEAGVILGIDGTFESNVFLKDKVTMILGSDDETKPLTFGGAVDEEQKPVTAIFAGGFDVSAMVEDEEYEPAGPAKLNMKIHEGGTEVLISGGTFLNSVVIGGDLVKLKSHTAVVEEKEVTVYDETKVNYYRVGDINTVIDGGIFTVTTDGGQRMIVGGEFYQAATKDGVRVSIGAANLTGDVNLTISGGSFKGYDVYGGNYANQKTFGKYATIDGNVTITLDSSDQALVFGQNVNKSQGGKIFAGSFGAGAITGDAKVILTGDEDITFEKLFGGSTGDFRSTSGTLESNVEGKRILSFTGFKGGLNAAAVIDGFNTVEISGENKLNFNVAELQYFNLDVTNWKFEDDAAVTGNFAFDFSGDKVDMRALDAGWELSNVTFNNKTQFAFAEGIGFNYDAESKLFSLVTLQS